MITREFAAGVRRALREFYEGKRGQPDLIVRLLRPLARRLSVERRLFLAKDDLTDLTAAWLHAKELWGDAGNVYVAANELRVGKGSGDAFLALGRGATWAEAFADAHVTEAEAP